MAISNLAAIAGAIAQTFAPKANRLWNRQAAFTSIVPKSRGRGKAVYWTVSNTGAVATTVAEGADVATSEYTISDKTPMSLNRGIYRSAFGLTHTELAAAMSAVNSSDVIMDLLGESFLDKYTALASKINQDSWAGTGTDGSGNNNIVGVYSGLITSGTYAGQNVGTVTGLQVNAQTGVGTLTTTNLRKAFDQIFTQSGTVPNFIMGSPNTCRQAQAIFAAPTRMLVGNQPLPVFDLGSQRPAEMNVPNQYFDGVPVLLDKDATDGYLLIGRTEDIELDILTYGDYGDAFNASDRVAVSSNGEEMEPLDVPLRCYPVAKTGSSVKFAMEVECQLKFKRPNAFALLSGISITN